MCNYLIAFVFAFVLMLGCSPQPVTQQQAPESRAATQTQMASAANPDEPALTAEEMAHNERVIEVAREIHLAIYAARLVNKNPPKWVAEHSSAFEQEEYSQPHVAFRRSVGWGTGRYKGKEFKWFAYTNTDGYLQFDFSVPISAEDLGKVIGGRKDRYGRLREARIPNPDTSPFLTGTGTWIGDTNDWTEDFCTSPKSEVCDLGGALQRSVTDLNKDLQLYLLIEGRFPW